jgi:hypothetical protein
MVVKMKSTRLGSPDAFNVEIYEEGKKYLMPDSLATMMIHQGFAVEAKHATEEGK